jgi:hypothetical protein
MSGGTLTAGYEYVGYSGTGTIAQTSGANGSVNPHVNLYLGYIPGGSGTYDLSGGNLFGSYEYVGFSGTGTMTQGGGGNIVYNAVGCNPILLSRMLAMPAVFGYG